MLTTFNLFNYISLHFQNKFFTAYTVNTCFYIIRANKKIKNIHLPG